MDGNKNGEKKNNLQSVKKESLNLHVMGKSDSSDNSHDLFWVIGGGIIVACLIFILFSLI